MARQKTWYEVVAVIRSSFEKDGTFLFEALIVVVSDEIAQGWIRDLFAASVTATNSKQHPRNDSQS